jgi:endonuclease YncB( thermonuclease family)
MVVLQFRRRSRNRPIALVAVGVAALAFVATFAFLWWEDRGRANEARAHRSSVGIEIIDGDTVRHQGVVYRLVGFDTPERGARARCDYERRQAETATARLHQLVASEDVQLTRVPCACRRGQEGTQSCNFGRLCGSLTVGGRDVGPILIREGLAHPYFCGATSCPIRAPWC